MKKSKNKVWPSWWYRLFYSRASHFEYPAELAWVSINRYEYSPTRYKILPFRAGHYYLIQRGGGGSEQIQILMSFVVVFRPMCFTSLKVGERMVHYGSEYSGTSKYRQPANYWSLTTATKFEISRLTFLLVFPKNQAVQGRGPWGPTQGANTYIFGKW